MPRRYVASPKSGSETLRAPSPSVHAVRARTLRRACLTLLAAASIAQPLRAQGAETLKALSTYHLTMPTVRKVIAAGRAIEQGPDAAALKDVMNDPAMTIEQVMAAYDRYPSSKRAVAATGLSSREFATAILALYWAFRFLAESEMEKAQGRTARRPPAHVPPENVELVRTNQAEIERLSKTG